MRGREIVGVGDAWMDDGDDTREGRWRRLQRLRREKRPEAPAREEAVFGVVPAPPTTACSTRRYPALTHTRQRRR
jgi:hypothetical protein